MTTDPRAVLRARLVALAAQEVGAHEEGGNNLGPRVAAYQAATNLPPGAWPWCAAFVCSRIEAWLRDPDVRSALGLTAGGAEAWRPRTALAFGLISWARRQGIEVLPPGRLARAGDIIVFQFSHAGLVETDQLVATVPIATIEGNTSPSGARDFETVDGVFRMCRSGRKVKALVRILP